MISMRRTSSGATAVAVLVLAGCGSSSSSSSGVTAAAYVKSICTAVGTFRSGVQAKVTSLSSENLSTPADGKKALQDFLSSVATEANTAASKVQSAGSPNVTNGKQIASTLQKAFTQYSASLQQAETQVGSLDTSSAAKFRQGSQGVTTNIRNSLTGLLGSLGTLHSTDLTNAAKKEPACTSLAGGG
jgi:hypothetical protein